MPGEVIRDVIVRMRVEHVGGKAFDNAAKQAGEATTATEKVEKATKKQAAAVRTLDQELAKTQAKAKAAADAATRGSKVAAEHLGVWIAKEKELQAQIEKRNALLNKARGIPGRPVAPAGPAVPGVGQTLEGLSSAAGKIAIPVAIVSMIPAVANAIGGAIRGTAFSLFGTPQERREKGSPFVNSLLPTDQVQGSAIGDAFGLALNSRIGRMFVDSPLGSIPVGGVINPLFGGGSFRDFSDRFQEERDAAAKNAQPAQFDFLSQEVEARERHLAIVEQLNARERSALEKELSGYEERIRMNQAIIQAEEARIDAAREQFGLLDARGKQDLIRIAEKVEQGGVGSLSREELKLIQGNSAFTGILSEEAKKAADASGFKEIIESLGLNEKIEKAEAQLELNVEQQQRITLELSNIDATVEKVRLALEETQRKFAEEMLTRVKSEIAGAMRRSRPPAGPDF